MQSSASFSGAGSLGKRLARPSASTSRSSTTVSSSYPHFLAERCGDADGVDLGERARSRACVVRPGACYAPEHGERRQGLERLDVTLHELRGADGTGAFGRSVSPV